MPGGRKKGSRNRGYFYRSGRGWFVTVGKSAVVLRDPSGLPIRERRTPDHVLREAYYRWSSQQAVVGEVLTDVTVNDVAAAYLEHAMASGAKKTYQDRSDTLFDFCTGYPPAIGRDGAPDPTEDDRIHDGYGHRRVESIIPLDIDQWLQRHPTWDGGRKTRVQAIKRAFNYATEAKLIKSNPIRGYRTPKTRARVTYFTPEQEAALLKHSNPQLALAIRVLIRTGARPGNEFANLTAAHVVEQDGRMEWRFKAHESKTRRPRVIRITDPSIISIVREQIRKYPTGPIFRNTQRNAWQIKILSVAFRRAKARVIKQEGLEFDADACLYTTRHTYAKRTLQGYWTNRATNIETLARLLGNSPQVCRDHYLQWTESYNEPLWDAC